MEIVVDESLSIIFVEIGNKYMDSNTINDDLLLLEKSLIMFQNNETTCSLIVRINNIPTSIIYYLPSVLTSVVNFSGKNKSLIETVIDYAYLVTQNHIGKKFFEMLLQRRQSQVPVKICSTIEEAENFHSLDHH